MSGIKDTIEKIKSLEAEKSSLLMEIQDLSRRLEAKKTDLETEVSLLRYEIRSLRSLIKPPDTDSNQIQTENKKNDSKQTKSLTKKKR